MVSTSNKRKKAPHWSKTLVGFFFKTKNNANPIIGDLYASLIRSTKIKGIQKLLHEEMIKWLPGFSMENS